MRTSPRHSLSAVVVCFALLTGPPSAAQSGSGAAAQTPAPADQRPTFRTEANFVRVDAYPMKDGRPVLDLAASDFEVLEDGVLQKLDSFEHVVVRAAGPQTERIEPSSQREMQQAVANPRNRVFVIFLDAPHVDVASSHDIAEPIIRLINRILGPDDLVGIMMPGMGADQITLARRTEVTEQQLRDNWTWGGRNSLRQDDLEQTYAICYPIGSPFPARMVARKRERATLEALQDLVRYLHGIREERKAILAVTEGWLLFKPDPSLLALATDLAGNTDPVPSTPPVTVGPDGRLTTRDPRTIDHSACEADRQRLANIDDEEFLRQIVQEANRSNATFYPIDPRGLPAFDTPIYQGVPVSVDRVLLRTRQNAMRELADGTDGLAVMNSNDLDKGLKRISDDLTSYYLLGYYSSNTRLDGGFRTLKVRVKRPGVDVRARRGYRAATAAEVSAARRATASPAPDVARPMEAALGALSRMRPEARLRLYAAPEPSSGVIWIAGELQPSSGGRADEWGAGATADVQVTRGSASGTARVRIPPGARTFLTPVKLAGAGNGDVDIQARVSGEGGGAPATDSIVLAAAEGTARPLLYRRGPTTGNQQQPTADLRFTRADRVHLELPVGADVKAGAGRLLDRAGQPLGIPVTLAERRDEGSGQRWLTADVVLAPLAPGDYVVELGTAQGTAEARVLTAIRVVR